MLPALHLVVPALDPGPAFGPFISELAGSLVRAGGPYRLLVVDDGSAPAERNRILDTLARLGLGHGPALGLQVLPRNEGKGAAIRAGWSRPGEAELLGFVDADGSVPAAEVVRLWRLAAERTDAACVLASRRRVAGHLVERRWHRHVLGRLHARWVQVLLGLSLHDTQCGLKFVRAAAYRRIVPWLREARFSFDVELLCRLSQSGGKLLEEPIDWADRGRSTVRLWSDGRSMLAAVWRLRRRLREEPG